MINNKIDFSEMVWETPAKGIKEKSFLQNGKRIRLLELSKDLEHPNWCETGHVGYVVEGEIEIEFTDKTIRYVKGDSLIMADGLDEKHIPKPISNKVILFLVENI